MMERMSKSVMPGSLSHLRKKCLRTPGSVEKMAVGMARSVTGAPCGRLAMTRRQLRPLSLTISAPKKSASRPAVVSDVPFWSPYSSSVLEMVLFSEMRLITSSSSSSAPRESSTSSQ